MKKLAFRPYLVDTELAELLQETSFHKEKEMNKDALGHIVAVKLNTINHSLHLLLRFHRGEYDRVGEKAKIFLEIIISTD